MLFPPPFFLLFAELGGSLGRIFPSSSTGTPTGLTSAGAIMRFPFLRSYYPLQPCARKKRLLEAIERSSH
jgi:hypothetical protein